MRFSVSIPVLCVCALFVGFAQNVTADERGAEPALPVNEHLKIFEPLMGKTFRGEFAASPGTEKSTDVSRWERAMNGQAVRILHSINDGAYGGETILMWDKKQEVIAFWYFTTAGFFTKGTMQVEGDSWTSIEEVSGNENGITKVKSISTFLETGEIETKSEYFSDGKWTPGHAALYRPAPDAKVIFK